MGRFAQSRISAGGHGEERQITRAAEMHSQWAARAALSHPPPAFCVIIAGNHYKRRGVQIKASQQIYTNRESSLSAACAKRSLGSGRQFYIYRGDNRTKSSLNANQIHQRRRSDANVYVCV
jgi:hypothetical protein